MNYHFDKDNHTFGIACINNVNSEDIKKIILEFRARNIEVEKIIENDISLANNGKYYAYKIVLSKSNGFANVFDLKKQSESVLLDYKKRKISNPNNSIEFDNLRNLNIQLLDKVNSLEKNIILNNEKLELIFEKNKIELESYFSKVMSLLDINDSKVDLGINSLSSNDYEQIRVELDEKINDYEDTIKELRNEIIEKGELINSVRNEEFGISTNNKAKSKGILVFGDTNITEIEITKIINSKLSPLFEPNIEFVALNYKDSKNSYRTLKSKLESGKFQYLIYGPSPHSITGKPINKSVNIEAQSYGIICYGEMSKPISKTSIEKYTDDIFRSFYGKNE
jgi:hypothetical protein